MKKKANRTVVTVLALAIMALFNFLPAPAGLSTEGMQIIGIFLGVLLLWITVGIDWPSLLCVAALCFLPSLGVNKVLQSSFGNQTFVFLLFTFMCTYALSGTSVIKRIALSFVTSKTARKGPWQLTILFFLSVIIIGLFMSPTVLFFIMQPILEEIYRIFDLKKGDKFAAMLMIGFVACASLSSAMTPIAHVFPVIAMGVFETAAQTTISYASYMGFAIPAGLLIFALMMLVFRFVLKPDTSGYKSLTEDDFKNLNISEKTDTREKLIVAIFVAVVAFWVLPGIVKGILPTFAAAVNKYGTAMPPLIGVIVMAVIRLDGKPLININEAMTKGVSWPSLIMSAATLSLGSAMTNDAIGLTAFLADKITPITHTLPPLLLIGLFVFWAALQSNLSSHMVTAQLVASIAVPVAMSTGSVNAAAIACVVGFVASIGSATPSSMPYVAVAGASEWTDAMELMKYGFIVMVITILTAVFAAYPVANMLLS